MSQKNRTPKGSKRVAFSNLPSKPARSNALSPSKSTGILNTGNVAPKVLILQNDLLCNPCTIIASLIDHDIEYHVVYAFHENAFKLLHPVMYEAMIVLGGRAGVYEQPEWLKQEMKFIKNALKLNIPILGICLGCQLLAECIGGHVYAGKKGVEIGYKPWVFPQSASDDASNSKGLDIFDKKTEFKLQVTPPMKGIAVEDGAHSMSLKYMPKAKSMAYGQLGFQAIGHRNSNVTKKKKEEKKPQKMLDDEDEIFSDDEIDFDEDDIFSDDEDEDDLGIDDPLLAALQPRNLGQFIILFHGDTFDLPKKCVISGQEVELLATTDRYNTLFRVGQYSYGFQGHPELNHDMLRVWCKCWGDDFLKKWPGDLEKDVIGFAHKNQSIINRVGRNVFDIWSKEVVLVKNKNKLASLKTKSFSNLLALDNGVKPKKNKSVKAKLKSVADDDMLVTSTPPRIASKKKSSSPRTKEVKQEKMSFKALSPRQVKKAKSGNSISVKSSAAATVAVYEELIKQQHEEMKELRDTILKLKLELTSVRMELKAYKHREFMDVDDEEMDSMLDEIDAMN